MQVPLPIDHPRQIYIHALRHLIMLLCFLTIITHLLPDRIHSHVLFCYTPFKDVSCSVSVIIIKHSAQFTS